MQIDIDIKPRTDALLSLGMSPMDFDAALDDALEELALRPANQLPGPGQIPVRVFGQEHQLGELAEILVRLG